jgi:hypothetical protein
MELVDIETLAALDPDPPHLGEDRLVGDVRRLQLHDLGGVGKNLPAGIVSTWVFGGVFMSTPGSTVPTTGLDGLTKARDRPDLEAGLDLVHASQSAGGRSRRRRRAGASPRDGLKVG